MSVSISIGTAGGGGSTIIGDNCLFMLGSHVGHDCKLGSNIVIANNSAIAGHVVIEDNVNIGGLVGVHQFCRLGEGSMIGAHAMVSKDVIPYSMIVGMRPVLSGVNLVGLKRRGSKKENIKQLIEVFSKIFDRKGSQNFQDRIKALDNDLMTEITEIQKDSFLSPDAIIMHPSDWYQTVTEVNAVTTSGSLNPLFVGAGQFGGAVGNTLWGLPVVLDTTRPAGTAIVGVFGGGQACHIVARQGMEVAMSDSHDENFVKDIMVMKATVRLGFPVYRPTAFCSITNI